MKDEQITAIVGLTGFVMVIVGLFKLLSIGLALLIVGGILFLIAVKNS